jgi:hypothetical protein
MGRPPKKQKDVGPDGLPIAYPSPFTGLPPGFAGPMVPPPPALNGALPPPLPVIAAHHLLPHHQRRSPTSPDSPPQPSTAAAAAAGAPHRPQSLPPAAAAFGQQSLAQVLANSQALSQYRDPSAPAHTSHSSNSLLAAAAAAAAAGGGGGGSPTGSYLVDDASASAGSDEDDLQNAQGMALLLESQDERLMGSAAVRQSTSELISRLQRKKQVCAVFLCSRCLLAVCSLFGKRSLLVMAAHTTEPQMALSNWVERSLEGVTEDMSNLFVGEVTKYKCSMLYSSSEVFHFHLNL